MRVGRPIRRVAVLGAGTMGAQIAALLANARMEVALFDVRADLATAAVGRLATQRPNPLFLPGLASRIATGSFDDLRGLADADWVIEAIVEAAEPKRHLLEAVDRHRRAGAVVSTNTSGMSITDLASGRSEDFRRHWVGTHFFNPPRYMHLVELIPTTDTDPALVGSMAGWLDERLGKGVVIARDTPAFIANRIGLFGFLQFLQAAVSGAFTLEEIDAVTGPIIGRPKSATFRTIDLAGLDVLVAVATDLATRLGATGGSPFKLPGVVDGMVHRGLLGEKTGRGFYQRVRRPDGQSTILTLDLGTLEYREAKPAKLPELDEARRIDNLDERLRQLFNGSHRAGDLLRRALGPTLVYAAQIAPEIAHGIDDLDRAMRWGFGWERGPFELWDAIGDDGLADALRGAPPVTALRDRQASGRPRWRAGSLRPAQPGLLLLHEALAGNKLVDRNASASLVDLGDGVLVVTFHSKLNTIGAETVAMIRAGLDRASRDFLALLIGHDEDPFSAGANLALLLLQAQAGDWDEVDAMVRTFQAVTTAMKYASVPVLVAPAGLALGGGFEICLHADRLQAAAESYLGLVEVGVGLIPAGGGTKEMILRAAAQATEGDPQGPLRQAFETIGWARVSTSAADARRLGFLRDVDGITMNRERLMADAKTRALARAAEGYAPPAVPMAIPVGGADLFAVLSLGVHLAHRAGRLTDHDVTIGRTLARVMTGGNLAHRATVSEAYLLDLEREAFLSLLGERATLDRIAHMLKTGRALRN